MVHDCDCEHFLMNSDGVCYPGVTETVKVEENIRSSFTYKPKGALAKALYEKQKCDEYLTRMDKVTWYKCDLKRVPDEGLSSKFVQLEPDEDTQRFLQQSEDKSDWIMTQLWHSVAKVFLGMFMTQTSINGWLQRGSMFVVSMSQFLKLLRTNGSWRKESLLDLGAGDGEVTARISSLFDSVYVTEMSQTMRNLLQKKGYQVLEVDQWHLTRKYDVISALNLIDRCQEPLQLLKDIKSSLKPGGFVLLAVVLPFSPYVELGTRDHKPKEILPVTGLNFEEQVISFEKEVFLPLGFEIVSWTRVPYLCEGDLRQSYYWLDDAVFLLKLRG